MDLAEKIVVYVSTHGDRRGRVRATREDLIWALRDEHPADPRPTVAELHRALAELKLRRRLIVTWWFHELQLRLPTEVFTETPQDFPGKFSQANNSSA